MCDKNSCCQKPENLEGKPEACSAEQIRICHGDGIPLGRRYAPHIRLRL